MGYSPHTKVETDEAATYVGFAKKTLEKYRVNGGGPRYLKLGRKVMYQVSDLDAWLETCRRQSTSEYQTGVAA